MRPQSAFNRSHGKGKGAMEECNRIYAETLSNVCNQLKLDSNLNNVVPVEIGAPDDDNNDWLHTIHAMIARFPMQPMDCSRFKTFTEVMEKARLVLDNAIDASTAADDSIADIESRNTNLRDDIEWHGNRIREMNMMMAAATG